jgi:hypothetical protein
MECYAVVSSGEGKYKQACLVCANLKEMFLLQNRYSMSTTELWPVHVEKEGEADPNGNTILS